VADDEVCNFVLSVDILSNCFLNYRKPEESKRSDYFLVLESDILWFYLVLKLSVRLVSLFKSRYWVVKLSFLGIQEDE